MALSRNRLCSGAGAALASYMAKNPVIKWPLGGAKRGWLTDRGNDSSCTITCFNQRAHKHEAGCCSGGMHSAFLNMPHGRACTAHRADSPPHVQGDNQRALGGSTFQRVGKIYTGVLQDLSYLLPLSFLISKGCCKK